MYSLLFLLESPQVREQLSSLWFWACIAENSRGTQSLKTKIEQMQGRITQTVPTFPVLALLPRKIEN